MCFAGPAVRCACVWGGGVCPSSLLCACLIPKWFSYLPKVVCVCVVGANQHVVAKAYVISVAISLLSYPAFVIHKHHSGAHHGTQLSNSKWFMIRLNELDVNESDSTYWLSIENIVLLCDHEKCLWQVNTCISTACGSEQPITSDLQKLTQDDGATVYPTEKSTPSLCKWFCVPHHYWRIAVHAYNSFPPHSWPAHAPRPAAPGGPW